VAAARRRWPAGHAHVGDFRRGYLVVDRTGIRILRDPYSGKPYVLFYTTKGAACRTTTPSSC
jgi:HK97 family phage major capsid protein